MIRIDNITKRFDRVTALERVSLAIGEGGRFGGIRQVKSTGENQRRHRQEEQAELHVGQSFVN